MKQLLSVLLSCMIMYTLSSCSDSSDDFPIEKPETASLQSITFEIGGFSESFGDEGRATPEEANIGNLYYFVFKKSDGSLVSSKYLDDPETFTVLKDSLQQGDYYVSVFASEAVPEPLYYHIDTYGDNAYDRASFFSRFGLDIFNNTIELSVGANPVYQRISLKRLVGKCEIIIDDIQNMPDDVEKFTFDFKNSYPAYYYLKSGNIFEYRPVAILEAYTPLISITREQALLNSIYNPHSFFMLPFSDNPLGENLNRELYMWISYKDGSEKKTSGPILVKKDFKLYRNKITRLSGKLFSDQFKSQIVIDDKWEQTIEDNFN